MQFLPDSPERRRMGDLPPGDAPAETQADDGFREDDAWAEARALAGTVEDHELVDPNLSSERLLYRLFHERGVTVFETAAAARTPAAARASASRRCCAGSPPQERRDMVGDDGRIGVTCEFCGVKREFDPADVEGE